MFILTYFTYKQCIYLVAIWGVGEIKRVQGLIRWVKCLPPKCETYILILSSQGRSQAQLQVCDCSWGDEGQWENWGAPDSESRSAVAFLSLLPHSSQGLTQALSLNVVQYRPLDYQGRTGMDGALRLPL